MTITLTLTDVDEDIVVALKKRATAHGRSLRDEHLEILKNALQGIKKRPLDDILRNMPDVGTDSDFDRHASPE